MNGTVIRVSSEKTAIVRVERSYMHAIYKKRIKAHKDIMVHDETGAKVGEQVEIVAVRPISKRKKHAVKGKL